MFGMYAERQYERQVGPAIFYGWDRMSRIWRESRVPEPNTWTMLAKRRHRKGLDSLFALMSIVVAHMEGKEHKVFQRSDGDGR